MIFRCFFFRNTWPNIVALTLDVKDTQPFTFTLRQQADNIASTFKDKEVDHDNYVKQDWLQVTENLYS